MSNLKFRNASPVRTYVAADLSPYNKYKAFLAADFQNRCGYTDCLDFWFGGPSTFHIDHFKPKSIYPELEIKYTNLVYASAFVNRAKRDDDGSYLDPCDVDYNLHFERNLIGEIVPNPDSPQASYMYKKLKLYLKRYSVIWLLENIKDRIDKVSRAIDSTVDSALKTELKEAYYDLNREFHTYLDYLRAER